MIYIYIIVTVLTSLKKNATGEDKRVICMKYKETEFSDLPIDHSRLLAFVNEQTSNTKQILLSLMQSQVTRSKEADDSKRNCPAVILHGARSSQYLSGQQGKGSRQMLACKKNPAKAGLLVLGAPSVNGHVLSAVRFACSGRPGLAYLSGIPLPIGHQPLL